MNRAKIELVIGQVISLVLGLVFLTTSVVFMSVVYQVIPNYSINGKPVAIINGPLVNTTTGLILMILSFISLYAFIVLRHKHVKA
jgi:hypothetical protein